MFRLRNLKINIDEEKELNEFIADYLDIELEDILYSRVVRSALDFKSADELNFIYTIQLDLQKNTRNLSQLIKSQKINEMKLRIRPEIKTLKKQLKTRPVVVGMGPAGLFAAYILAKHGAPPILIERGKKVEERKKDVHNYWKTGEINSESNVQFGEGGAGTFSDGKLTTRLRESRLDEVLDLFIECGAPKAIKDGLRAHVGTDYLYKILINLRKMLCDMGVEIRFSSKLEDVIIEKDEISKIIVNDEKINCENLIIAIGNGARDSFSMLHKRGIKLEPKNFGMGVRIEHPRELINKLQYGKFYNHPKLGTADYSFFHNDKVSGRSIYSFCMCPGGFVVASASSEHEIVTNGMSNFNRMAENSNSAILVSVTPEDFNDETPLGGILLQKKWEEIAFKTGGSCGLAPAQNMIDFLENTCGRKVKFASYKPGILESDLTTSLPEFVAESLKTAFKEFDVRRKGFISEEAVLTAIETRSSSPVRIVRGEDHQSVTVKGIYPCGEGSGYSGGIMCSAIDGIKTAEKLLEKLHNNFS